MNKEESAIDVIYEVRDLLKAQQTRMDLLEKNLAMISSKVNETLFPDLSKLPKGKAVVATPPPPAPKPAVVTKPVPKPLANPSVKQPVKNIKAYGHMQDDLGKNLGGVDVRIMDTKNRVIKQTKTNRAGTWMSFLPPGRYSVEFSMQGMMSDSRIFDLVAGQKEVEVS